MSNWKDKLTQLFYIQAVKPVYRVMFEHRVAQFITDLRKHDEEELIKIVDKLKLDVETRIAFKNLKPESVGYNKCALKVQIKIKQIKQLIKDYYAK